MSFGDASPNRRAEILKKLMAGTSRELETRRMCEVAREVTGVSGAGVMLMSGGVPHGSICSTDDVSALIERLQFELGEGPCVDAYHHGRPVLEPDLVAPVTARWLAFTAPAVAAGARAVFGFPLHVGAARIGALNLYCDRAGSLSDGQHSDALVMADVAAHAVLLMQAKAPPGKVAAELEAGAEFRYVVHQAAGMVAAQLDVSVSEALVRLRAYAFGNDRTLAQVAQQVVARNLRFG